MKKVLVVFAVVMVFFSKAQITDYQKLIDSISQKRWDSTALDIDSLSNPKIIDIRSLKKDSVQLTNNMVIVSNTSDTSPLTPSSIINLPTLKR